MGLGPEIFKNSLNQFEDSENIHTFFLVQVKITYTAKYAKI